MPDHPYAAGLQQYCLGFEGAFEDYPWGEVVYKVGKKMFATLVGGPEGLRMTVKTTHLDAEMLTGLPHVARAAYIGRYGWVTVSIRDEATLDHARELVAASYEQVAPKRQRGRER